jgi:stress-induced morphogen
MNRSERITSQVKAALAPLHLELDNESHQHSGPGSETHFKILVVASQFEGLSRVDRQRKVYSLLDQEFKSGLHALTLRALTPQEWEKQGGSGFVSPACAGGSKN